MSITKTFYRFPRKLKEEAQCTPEGTREGLTRVYYRNGTLKKEVVYKNGKKDGIEKEYSRQGSMHCEISYHGGVRDGIYRCYTKGNLSREYTYKKGRKEGPARRLYKDGTRFEFECKDGREKVSHGETIIRTVYWFWRRYIPVRMICSVNSIMSTENTEESLPYSGRDFWMMKLKNINSMPVNMMHGEIRDFRFQKEKGTTP